MKHFTLIFLFLSITLFASLSAPVQIIPYPAEITYGEGHLTLSANFTIEAADAIRFEADYLADILKKGFSSNAPQGIPCSIIELHLDDASISQFGEEGYLLSTNSNHILIRAATPAGIFYGIQTLRQLLPVDFESSSRHTVEIARVEVVDQ
ncbi:MAG: glycoside hydrolase family 20, partial [Bacteroidia bacterium]|nr:glycoside hydrolase family 20 [Bacteroidia bacterium]